MTNGKELDYNYFSQTLLPNYIEEHGVFWRVVYDARGHFEEPHTNRSLGCGTIEVNNYLNATKGPDIVPAEFSDANVAVIGPDGGIAGVLFTEKEGFNPLFKAVNLANRFDLMIISTKGVSVTAARKLVIDHICGKYDLPLFVLHDFDVAGFMISGTLQRDTRRFQFTRAFEVVDLGLRLNDIEGLEREHAAKSNISEAKLREQLAENGATPDEVEFLLDERVELNAMASDDFVAMIERKLSGYGLKKVVPAATVLAYTYLANSTAATCCGKSSRSWKNSLTRRPRTSLSRTIWRNRSAQFSNSTPTCGGTTLSRSCWTKRSFRVCGQIRKRPNGSPKTSLSNSDDDEIDTDAPEAAP